MYKMKNKKEIVIWSGGCDSTYLLHDLGRKSSIDNPIYTLSVVFKNRNKEMVKLEKEAREKILEDFRKRGMHIKHKEIVVSRLPDISSNQPLEWLSIIAPFISTNSNVHFSYIFEDSLWHKKKEFVDAFYSLMSIKCQDKINISLYFDLEWLHKREIVAGAKNNKFIKMVFTCEHPKNNKACKKCDKCKELKNTLEELK